MSSQESHPQVRTVESTQSEMTEIILPNDTNMLGNLLGGRLMHFIDVTGAMAAYRHARTHVVTASMDHIDFIQPVRLGDLVTLKSSVNRAFTSSMAIPYRAKLFLGSKARIFLSPAILSIVLASGPTVFDRAAGDLRKWQGLPKLEQDAATQPAARLCQ